jgi:hypothetical protein
VVRFLINFQFYAPQLVLDHYAADIYLNGVIIGLSEIGANLFAMATIDCLPRRSVYIVFSLIQCLICLPLVLFYACLDE